MNEEICIISVGIDGREKYSNYACELKKHADNLGYKNFVWINDLPPNSPSHAECNYVFKAYAFEHAINNGYNKILWLDSKCYPQKQLKIIEQNLNTIGYWIPNEGYDVGSWCKDEAYPYLGIDKEEAFNIKQISAKHFGINLKFDISKKFIDEFIHFAKMYGKETYHGSSTNERNQISNDPRVRGHRHDQIVASVIAYKLKMNLIQDVEDAIDWRDRWKFRNSVVEGYPEILVDGYGHGKHDCACRYCQNIFNEVHSGKRKISPYFLR